MLTRLYVDNYKTLSNFELTLGSVQLLMGRNGTGKSSVLEVLAGLRALVIDGENLVRVFSPITVSAWSKSQVQVFELIVMLSEERYTYRLEVEQAQGPTRGVAVSVLAGSQARVKAESVHVGETPLFGFQDGHIQLHRDDGSKGPDYPSHSDRSGLAGVVPGRNNPRLIQFKDWLASLLIVRPIPAGMTGFAPGEASYLDPSLRNFSEWYRALHAARPMAVVRGLAALQEVVIGFDELSMEQDLTYRTGHLRVRMKGPQGSYKIDFEDLSDGQRALIALYVILYAAADSGRLLIFDEPDNFVALAELQPFLNELLDRALDASGPQVVLISHHPEFINPLAPERGLVFSREQAGPTRVKPFESDALLPAAEVVARGGQSA